MHLVAIFSVIVSNILIDILHFVKNIQNTYNITKVTHYQTFVPDT